MATDLSGFFVATRDTFSDEELRQLRGFPDLSPSELIRYFTLPSTDEAFVRRFRGRGNVLGASVQLCTLLWLGFVPDDLNGAPVDAIKRLSEQLSAVSWPNSTATATGRCAAPSERDYRWPAANRWFCAGNYWEAGWCPLVLRC